jgi:hypothetical protein
MPNIYYDNSSDPKYNAQHALQGKTHYCDDDTLRFHKSRITHSETVSNGTRFLIVEAYAVDYRNTQRAFRGVIFNLDGRPVYRPELNAGFSSTAIALKHARKALTELEANDGGNHENSI